MPKPSAIIIYDFDELSESAKETARSWYREGIMDWEGATFDDAVAMGELLGIEIGQRPVTLMSGAVRYDPAIFYSGFYSQGDGACFEGRYGLSENAGAKLRDAAPEDTRLHAIADTLDALQAANGGRLTATVEQSGHYSHSGCTRIAVELSGDDGARLITLADEKSLIAALREFMDWIYRQLQTEYDYQSADAQCDESIRANEYTFDEHGHRRD